MAGYYEEVSVEMPGEASSTGNMPLEDVGLFDEAPLAVYIQSNDTGIPGEDLIAKRRI